MSDLLDEMDEAWVNVERAIWPNGPASGTGSGAYAALKARIIALLRDGTTTECPVVGVHGHAFRGPHRFQEWEPNA